MKRREGTTPRSPLFEPLVASLAIAAATIISAAGCGQDPTAPGDTPAARASLRPDRIVIHDDPVYLESRLERTSKLLSVRGQGVAPDAMNRGPAKSSNESAGRLTLVGQVLPPEVDGRVVQANDIEIWDHTAVVAYNFAGDPFAGAVQVIDFTHPERPVLFSEVLYRDADVDAVALLGEHLYVGLASSDPALSTPAMIEELRLTGHGLETTGNWLDLPSWAVTDLAVDGHWVVASVGARAGGVALVETGGQGLQLAGFVPAEDARAVDCVPGLAAMNISGGEARLRQLAIPGLGSAAEAAVNGYRTPAAKGTLEIHDGRCYLGAGDGGFQLWSLDGHLLDALDNGAFASLRSGLAVTNAVSASGRLAFVAAGALGLQVVDVGRWHPAASGVPSDHGLQVLGELAFEDGASSNMVKAKNNILVVAAGSGGVKLVEMDLDE